MRQHSQSTAQRLVAHAWTGVKLPKSNEGTRFSSLIPVQARVKGELFYIFNTLGRIHYFCDCG